MKRPLDVTIGIPTCDDDPLVLSLALDAIAAEPVEAPPIILDMSSTDQIADMVRSRRERLRYVRARDSSGVSDSRNRIVGLADSRYLLFLDADAVPRPGWALALTGALSSAEDVALVGARILPRWPRPAPPLFTTAVAL
jgi:GT2 family glycosyltransferase